MPNQDFPRSKRMLSSEEYDQVFKKPARAGSRGLLILARMNDCSTPRLGLVVPKKVLKRAVWRNRVKRLVRESFASLKTPFLMQIWFFLQSQVYVTLAIAI